MILYENLDVNELLLKIRSSDDLAFAELVRRYEPMLNKLVSMHGAAGISPEEAYAEACVALHKASLAYKLDLKEVTFGLFARICVQRRLSDFFSAKSSRCLPTDIPIEDAQLESTAGSAEAELLMRERLINYMSVAREILSDYEYRVFLLYMQDYDTDAMCHELSRDKKSVENAKARMLMHLRAKAALFANI